MQKLKKLPEYRTRAESFTGITELAQSLGHELTPIFNRYGISPDVLTEPDKDISYKALCQILEDCAREWDCPDFGLRLARIQNLNILGAAGLVARLSNTVGEALKALAERMSIHSTGFEVYLYEGDPALRLPASISYTPKPESGFGRQILELSLGIIRNVLATATGMADFKPLRVTFQHSMPENPEPASYFFAAPIHYQELENRLYFDPAILQMPTAIRDTAYAPLIRAYLEQICTRQLEDIVATTRQLISKLLNTGKCSREQVAQCLHMHPRTFQRRLSEQGVTFNQLLDDYRKTLALDLLAHNNMPLVQIADLLGYADQSTFQQAFRRWTNSTPMAYRKLKTAD